MITQNDSNLDAISSAISSHKDYLYKRKLFATGLTIFKSNNLKYSRNCYCECHSLTDSILLLHQKKKRISEKVTPGFHVEGIPDFTASSRIKLHSVCNLIIQIIR